MELGRKRGVQGDCVVNLTVCDQILHLFALLSDLLLAKRVILTLLVNII